MSGISDLNSEGTVYGGMGWEKEGGGAGGLDLDFLRTGKGETLGTRLV